MSTKKATVGRVCFGLSALLAAVSGCGAAGGTDTEQLGEYRAPLTHSWLQVQPLESVAAGT